jgi:hypothetical protein
MLIYIQCGQHPRSDIDKICFLVMKPKADTIFVSLASSSINYDIFYLNILYIKEFSLQYYKLSEDWPDSCLHGHVLVSPILSQVKHMFTLLLWCASKGSLQLIENEIHDAYGHPGRNKDQ